MSDGEDKIYRNLRFDRDGVDFRQWPKLSCSAANELSLATQDDPNPGVARLAIAGELKLQVGVAVNELSSDGKLTNNSDLAIPTQKAVKTYVDNQIAVVNQSLSTKAALNGASSQDFQSKNLSVSGNLTANGNVSIGTTSSSYKLAIAAGDINIDDSRALRQAGRWVIGGNSNVLSIGSSDKSDGRDIRLDPGFSGALTVKKGTGNVGIGTTNPTARLHIYSADNDALKITNTTLSKTCRMGVDHLGVWIEPSETNSSIRLNANPSLLGLFVRGTDGKVGIGTTSPGAKLEVKGHLTLDADDNPILYTGTENSELNRYLQLINSPALGSASGLKAGGILVSDSYAYANPSKNDLIVKGNVGIGTANPTVTLDIDGDLRVRDPSSIGNIHLFLGHECVALWSHSTGSGGNHITDVSAYVPATAKGAVIRVIVNSNSDGASSFVCADRNGNYSNLAHYSQNGFTNYSGTWVGGVVFCPFYKDKAFKWKMVSNNADPSPVASSYGSLIGWF
jgi:hypothetical protein